MHTIKVRYLHLLGVLGITGLNAELGIAQNAVATLEEVVVTAQRREENLQSTPISVAAFSTERLQDLNVQDPRDLTAYVPNFSMGNATGRSTDKAALSIRGVNEALLSLVTSPAVGVYIDDVYYGQPLLSFLKLIDVERVEVLRGPQGTLFGRNTTGGAVSYITRRPEFDEFSGYVRGTMGDFGRIDVSSAANLPLGDNLAVRLKAASLSRDGYVKRLTDGENLGAEDAVYGSAQLRWQPSDRVDVNLSLDYTRRDTDTGPQKLVDYYAYNGARDISPPPFTPGAASSAAWNFFWGGTPLRYEVEIPDSLYEVAGTGTLPRLLSETVGFTMNVAANISDSIVLRSITGFRDVDELRRNDLDDDSRVRSVFDDFTDEGVETWSQELQLSGAGDRVNWVGGIYYSDDEYFERGIFTPDPRALGAWGMLNLRNDGRQETTHTGLYAQATFDLTEQMALTAGVRYSEDDKSFRTNQTAEWDFDLAATARQFGLGPVAVPASLGCDPIPTGSCQNIPEIGADQKFDSTTPRLALEYQWTDDLMTYVAASEGFKSGGTNDAPQDVAIAFEPEEVRSYEIGVRSEFADDRVRINATYFTMDYTNKQITVAPTTAQTGFINPCFSRCILNAGDGEIDGVELESLFAVSDNVQLHANIATIDAGFTSVAPGAGLSLESDFALAPELSYNLGGRFDMPTGNGGLVSLLLDWSFTDEQETSPQDSTTLTMPDYELMTLRLKYTSADGTWDASIFCTNCLDEEYVMGGSAWGASTDNTNFSFKPSSHNAFTAGGLLPNLIVVPDVTYVLVGAPRMSGLTFNYNF